MTMPVLNFWPFSDNPQKQFESLLRPQLSRLYALAYRLTSQREDAEDLVQELLIKLYPRLDEIQALDNPAPWLSRVLYNLYVDHYRRQKRSPVDDIEDETQFYDPHGDDSTDPARIVNTQLTNEVLNEALHSLNDDQRELIVLHDVEGYSLPEINEMTGVAVGTIKSRLSRAREKLRDKLNSMEPESLA